MSYRPYNLIIAAASASSTGVSYSLINASGSPMAAYLPVTLDSSGDIKPIDVSVESDALRIIGITIQSILNATAGSVMNLGRIENVTGFNLGDVLYVSKTGGLTTTLPEIGVGGFVASDFVIKIAKISKNQTNPSNKDMIVQIQLIGQL